MTYAPVSPRLPGHVPFDEEVPQFYPATVRQLDLCTRNRDRLAQFYGRLLGLQELTRTPHELLLGTARVETSDAPTLRLRLVEDPHARARPRGTVGLEHAAFLFSSNASLAAATRRLMALAKEDPQVQVHGYLEHGASEAVYALDPDGNGVELTADHPFALWPRPREASTPRELALFSWPVDLQELLQVADPAAEEAPVFGHLHLNVSDLASARELFVDQMGLHVTQSTYPGALFLAFGDYHHHLAVNIWAGRQASAPPPGTTGLLGLTLRNPQGAELHLSPSQLAN